MGLWSEVQTCDCNQFVGKPLVRFCIKIDPLNLSQVRNVELRFRWVIWFLWCEHQKGCCNYNCDIETPVYRCIIQLPELFQDEHYTQLQYTGCATILLELLICGLLWIVVCFFIKNQPVALLWPASGAARKLRSCSCCWKPGKLRRSTRSPWTVKPWAFWAGLLGLLKYPIAFWCVDLYIFWGFWCESTIIYHGADRVDVEVLSA